MSASNSVIDCSISQSVALCVGLNWCVWIESFCDRISVICAGQVHSYRQCKLPSESSQIFVLADVSVMYLYLQYFDDHSVKCGLHCVDFVISGSVFDTLCSRPAVIEQFA